MSKYIGQCLETGEINEMKGLVHEVKGKTRAGCSCSRNVRLLPGVVHAFCLEGLGSKPLVLQNWGLKSVTVLRGEQKKVLELPATVS